jgi:hypothetical protein
MERQSRKRKATKTAKGSGAARKVKPLAKKPKSKAVSLIPEVEVNRGRPVVPYSAGEVVPFARTLAEDGKTDVEIARALGIGLNSFYDWQRRYPEFREAVVEGKSLVDARVERALQQRATGFTSQIPYVDANGEDRVRTVVFPPNVSAAIEWLRNRQPDKWKNRRDVTLRVPGQIDTGRYSRQEQADLILGKRTE